MARWRCVENIRTTFSEMPPRFEVLRLLCVQAIEMPRLGTGKTKVYIKFDSLASAQKGHQNLHGRSFEARCESSPPPPRPFCC